MRAALLILLLLVAACAEEVAYSPEPEPQPEKRFYKPTPQPVAPKAPDPWTPVTQTNAETQINGESLQAKDVYCNLNESLLKFTIRNRGNDHWHIDNDHPLQLPAHTVKTRVLLNGLVANGPTKYNDGVRAFGPGETFPENCGGIERLQLGQETTCIVHVTPLRTSVDNRPNEITIDPQGSVDDTTLKFFC